MITALNQLAGWIETERGPLGVRVRRNQRRELRAYALSTAELRRVAREFGFRVCGR
jgi:hypothetical protein